MPDQPNNTIERLYRGERETYSAPVPVAVQVARDLNRWVAMHGTDVETGSNNIPTGVDVGTIDEQRLPEQEYRSKGELAKVFTQYPSLWHKWSDGFTLVLDREMPISGVRTITDGRNLVSGIDSALSRHFERNDTMSSFGYPTLMLEEATGKSRFRNLAEKQLSPYFGIRHNLIRLAGSEPVQDIMILSYFASILRNKINSLSSDKANVKIAAGTQIDDSYIVRFWGPVFQYLGLYNRINKISFETLSNGLGFDDSGYLYSPDDDKYGGPIGLGFMSGALRSLFYLSTYSTNRFDDLAPPFGNKFIIAKASGLDREKYLSQKNGEIALLLDAIMRREVSAHELINLLGVMVAENPGLMRPQFWNSFDLTPLDRKVWENLRAGSKKPLLSDDIRLYKHAVSLADLSGSFNLLGGGSIEIANPYMLREMVIGSFAIPAAPLSHKDDLIEVDFYRPRFREKVQLGTPLLQDRIKDGIPLEVLLFFIWQKILFQDQ